MNCNLPFPFDATHSTSVSSYDNEKLKNVAIYTLERQIDKFAGYSYAKSIIPTNSNKSTAPSVGCCGIESVRRGVCELNTKDEKIKLVY